jgi:hypothetical protein
MKYLLFLSIPVLTGCVCLNPKHKALLPPTAKTEQIIDSLERTKTSLEKAGQSSTVIGEKVDRALTLTERLNQLLEQIETSDKIIKEPIK